ncbi:MAG: hypothetical protein PHU46_15055 [Rhodocyclaceae bacterium]|nr:hypothetical protein [Rhodocyclaceae bacterium]
MSATGRQRVVRDGFWRDPDLAEITQEEKSSLLYLLTSPSSNIGGVYRLVWRVAGAEMGWTAEQFLSVLARLRDLNKVDFEENTGFVWVKIWWNHNSTAGAFSPKLRKIAIEEVAAMPEAWRGPYLQLLEENGIDRASIGYPYPSDGEPPNSNSNHIHTPTSDPKSHGSEVVSGILDVFLLAAGNPSVLVTMLSDLSKKLGNATKEQAQWAGAAWREAAEKGGTKSPEAYAVYLCKRASLGLVTRPAGFAEQEQNEAIAEMKNGWTRLMALHGQNFRTPGGKIAHINPNGTISFPDGSVSGVDALKALALIESGVWVELP